MDYELGEEGVQERRRRKFSLGKYASYGLLGLGLMVAGDYANINRQVVDPVKYFRIKPAEGFHPRPFDLELVYRVENQSLETYLMDRQTDGFYPVGYENGAPRVGQNLLDRLKDSVSNMGERAVDREGVTLGDRIRAMFNGLKTGGR